jgi:type IV pilus assembly protein PilM
MAGTNNGILSKISGMFSSLGGPSIPLGLSIGSSSVKLMELRKISKKWKMLQYGASVLSQDTIVNREIINPVEVKEAIRNLSRELKIESKPVCTGLSGPSVMVKRMSVEVKNLKELEDTVFWEAEQYLPFDPNDVVMDFHSLSKGKDHQIDVILVAAKSLSLDETMKCIEDAGLKPKIVDLELFALQNVFEVNYPDFQNATVVLVDIGSDSTKILISENGVPLFTKESNMGGDFLTEQIQKHLGISRTDAETLKTSSGKTSLPQEVSELMAVANENIAQEIKRTLDFYNASSSGGPLQVILLPGGGARLPDLTRVIEEKTNLPTQLLNPFQNVSYDDKQFTPDFIEAMAPQMVIPMGLAMRAGS